MSDLICAVCWFTQAEAEVAVTVIEGYAVCEDHQGYVAQGARFASIINAARAAVRPTGSEATAEGDGHGHDESDHED